MSTNTSTQQRSRKAQREETRAAVLAAAEDAFAARGFDGASMSAIAEDAGAPVPLIVYHFGSKLGLWQAVVEAVFARLNARVAETDAALEGDVSAGALHASIRAHVASVIENPSYMRLTLKEGTEETERLAWLTEHHQRPFTARIVAVIERAQAAGLLPEGADPMMLKYLIAGAVSLPFAMAPEYAALTGVDTRTDEYADAYAALCLRVLTGQGEAGASG